MKDMLDPAFVRDNPELVDARLRSRGMDPSADLAALEAVAGEPPAQGQPLVLEYRRGPERRIALLVPKHGDQMRVPLPELDKAWSGVEVQPITTSLARELGLPEGDTSTLEDSA